MKISVFGVVPWRVLCGTAFLFACGVASAGSISSLSVSDRFDNCEMPAPAIVASDETIDVVIDPEWFGGGKCELYVDEILVTNTSDTAAAFSIDGVADSWRSYKLKLVAGSSEITRYITLFPSADFFCSCHSLIEKNKFLDSSPAGTLRRIKAYQPRDIAWSSLWNDGAQGAVVKLYAGEDTSAAPVAELVSGSAGEEGLYSFLAEAEDINSGVCTLTHFDGVETLTASFRLGGRGTFIILK